MRRVLLDAPGLPVGMAGMEKGRVWTDVYVDDDELVAVYYDPEEEERVGITIGQPHRAVGTRHGEEFVLPKSEVFGPRLAEQLVNYGLLVVSRTQDEYTVYALAQVDILVDPDLDCRLLTIVDVGRERGLVEWSQPVTKVEDFADLIYDILTNQVPALRHEKASSDQAAEQYRELFEEVRIKLDASSESLRQSQVLADVLMQEKTQQTAEIERFERMVLDYEQQLDRNLSNSQWTENKLRTQLADMTQELRDQRMINSGLKQAIAAMTHILANPSDYEA